MLNWMIKRLTGPLACAGSSAQRVFEIIDLQPDIPVDDGVRVGSCSSQLSRRWLNTPWPFLVEVGDLQCVELSVDGRLLCEYSLKSVDMQVCVVSQDTQVFCRSIRDNLTQGWRQLAWPMPTTSSWKLTAGRV